MVESMPQSSNQPVHDGIQHTIKRASSLQYTRQSVPSLVDYSQDFHPSITTVERAAATKAAMEVQYEAQLTDPSPRELRRRTFEHGLVWKNLSRLEEQEARMNWAKQETSHLRQIRALKTTSISRCQQDHVSIDGFDAVRVIGRGSFGTVRLIAQNSEPDEQQAIGRTDGSDSMQDVPPAHNTSLYALKVIRKPGMLLNCQEAHLRAERDFLAQADSARSPWIVSLYSAFQDRTNLYLVMEFMVGGDFLGILMREDVLEESVAR